MAIAASLASLFGAQREGHYHELDTRVESITGANSWSNFYFWAGIAALLALGVFEVFSHRYTERKDELVAQQQDETQRRHDEEMARLHLEQPK